MNDKTGSAGLDRKDSTSLILHGVGASRGIVVGKILVLRRHTIRAGWYHLPPDRIDDEVARFRGAVNKAEDELIHIRSQFAEDLSDALSIIDSHILMLRDRMIYDRCIDIIVENNINAEWALVKALGRIKAKFEKIADPYIKARYDDVKDVADRVFGILSGRVENPLADIDDRVIVVGHDFSPTDTMQMRSEKILGFITEKGGITSHTAIVARSLGIPAVIGLENITRQCATGETVILDGQNGHVILCPTRQQQKQYRQFSGQDKAFSDEMAFYIHLRSETLDGYRVRLSANIETADELRSVVAYGAEGIGLFRSEFDYFKGEKLPDEEMLFTTYSELLSALDPLPVTIRTLDVGGDKFVDHLPAGSVRLDLEKNPALGLRSIRYSLRDQRLFIIQLRALLRASVFGNLRILFPMITTMRELLLVREILDRVKGTLAKDRLAFKPEIDIGIMIEVPSAVIMADTFAGEVDFFSIGTNDMIQYSLAIDRNNEHVAHMYDPLNPAIIRMIKQAIDAGHARGIEVSLCGEMAGDIITVPVLLGLGIDELSMRPSALPFVKRLLRFSCSRQLAEIGSRVVQCEDGDDVRKELNSYFSAYYPDKSGGK